MNIRREDRKFIEYPVLGMLPDNPRVLYDSLMSQSPNPYRWIPSLYVMQGLPFALITAVSAILYKNLDISNTKIAFFTSLFAVPWLLKPLLAPTLENVLSKKTLTVLMQLLMAGCCLLLAGSLSLHHVFILSGMIFIISAFISSMHDICSDGLYIVSLNKFQQAHFIGPRSLFYQFGKILCQGGLVFAVGMFSKTYEHIFTWQMMFILLACLILVIAVYHYTVLPNSEKHKDKNNITVTSTFKNVYSEFFTQPFVLNIICFTVLYELPQSQLMKIVPLFLLDPVNHHGLGLSTSLVGIVYGGIGLTAMIIGITLSGWLLSNKTLKQTLMHVTALAALSNVGYLYLCHWHFTPLWLIGFIISIAQFGFGLSNGAYMVYLLHTFGKGSHPMSTFAIGTALMSLGTVIAGMISGYIQYLLGYCGFFIWIVIASILITLFTLKVKLP